MDGKLDDRELGARAAPSSELLVADAAMVASSVPAILPLPTTSAEATTQAVAATTLALRAHDRVQVALHGETLDGHLLCTSLLRSIREELPRTRLFVDGVAAARGRATPVVAVRRPRRAKTPPTTTRRAHRRRRTAR